MMRRMVDICASVNHASHAARTLRVGRPLLMDLVSPLPFWLLQNGLLTTYPSLKENVRCDVVVLGAGITGALVAENLARAGREVVVIDRRDAGAGSTCASTGLLQYEIDTALTELIRMIGRPDAERAYQVCHESIDTIAQLVADLGEECTFERKPSVYLAMKKSEAADLREECAARRAAGIEVEYLESAEIAARFSFSRPAALLSKQGGEIDAHRFTHALLARATEFGARIFDRTHVAEVEPQQDGVRLKTDRGCVVQAAQAVFATGYEAEEYLPRRVLRLKSTFALVSEPLDSFRGWWERALLWETARPYLYLRTTCDGRAMIGGGDDPFRDPARRDALVEKKAKQLAKQFREMFPAIDFTPEHRWAGTFGETKDGLAFIGAVRQMPRCHFALGFGGNGITYSAVAAEILREAIGGRVHRDAHLFRFDR